MNLFRLETDKEERYREALEDKRKEEMERATKLLEEKLAAKKKARLDKGAAELALKNDPEYTKYIELQKKFSGKFTKL
jgi:hypothetical protein